MMRKPPSHAPAVLEKPSPGLPVVLIAFMTSLLLITAMVVTTLDAAPASQTGTAAAQVVDRQLWHALRQAPDHRATFVLTLANPSGHDPEAIITAQMGLEEVLETMLRTGSIDDFQSYYGANAILIRGSIDAVHYLAALPITAEIRLAQNGESWRTNFDAEATAGTGMITGQVSAAAGGAALAGIEVRVYRQFDPISWVVAGTTSTNASGDYGFTGLDGGIYRARFRDPSGFYVTEFYNNQFSFDSANGFNVIDDQTTPNISAAMETGGFASGQVREQGDGILEDITVTAWRQTGAGWQIFASDLTDNHGDYTIGGLISDTYRIQFSDFLRRFVTEYYDNKGDLSSADSVSVTAGQTTSGIDAEMGSYGSLSGNLTGSQGLTGVDGIDITVYEYDAGGGFWDFVTFAESDGDGNYQAFGLLTKAYRVEFSDSQGFFELEYYDGRPDIDSATDVPVTLGLETTGIDASLSPPVITQTYPVAADWNLISFPLHVPDTETGAAFASVAGSYDAVWAYDDCETPGAPWKAYDPAAPPIANTLKNVDVKYGMWLQMTSPMALTISGTLASRTTFDLCQGWNLISWPSTTTVPVAEGLTQIDGQYDIVWAYVAADTADPWKKYNPDAAFGNDLINLQPGFGYWVRMTEPGILTVTNR